MDEFERAAAAFPDLDDTFSPGATTQTLGGAGAFPALDDEDDFGMPTSAPSNPGPGIGLGDGDGLDEFERATSAFPALDDVEGPASAPSLQAFEAQPSFHIPTPQQPIQTFQSPVPVSSGPNYAGFTQPEEPEPEVVRQWREHQQEKIAQRDEEAKAKRAETIAKAERDIDKFYEEYNAKKERQIRENKENEANYLSNLTDSLSAGTTWSRICDLIDLENSQSKTVARAGAGATDLARYREVLLRLRKQGDKAPGAAGY
ncbi:clathrin light chain [Ceratobasidium sp. AG-Ba]|nr:clathrin light chain [Ceratobasidium sp. AG-Ba]